MLVVFTFMIPYLPFVSVFGFVALPGALVLALCVTTALYVITAEAAKRWFYRSASSTRAAHAY